MGWELKKFIAGTMDKGIQVNTSSFQTDLVLDLDAYNVTQGIHLGLGPRQGISPLPGQSDTETLVAATGRLPGLMKAEEGNGVGYFTDRRKILGIVRLNTSWIGVSPANYYFMVVIDANGNLDASPISKAANASLIPVLFSDLARGGLSQNAANSSDYNRIFGALPLAEMVAADTTNSKSANLQLALRSSTGVNYASIATLSVSGGSIPMQWYVGDIVTAPDATHAPSLSLWGILDGLKDLDGNLTPVNLGLPSEFVFPFRLSPTPRNMFIYPLKNDATSSLMYYSVSVVANSGNFIPGPCVQQINLLLSSTTATKSGVGVDYAAQRIALVNDNNCTSSSAYQAILVADGTSHAKAVLVNGWTANGSSQVQQVVDLANSPLEPRTHITVYNEETLPKRTCLISWPDFVRGTPMVSAAGGPTLDDSLQSGVLLGDTVYEFTFSMYHKRFNCESNVGVPVKFQTGTTTAGFALQLFNLSQPMYAECINNGGMAQWMPFAFGQVADTNNPADYRDFLYMNFIEYRFYYRQEGTTQWLVAGYIDAAQLWFRPNFQYWVCTGNEAGLPGGQAGGFIDYSRLPADIYKCVVQYKNRAWWFSDTAVVFSLPNNIFAYPAANSIAATSGIFRGAIVHNYPGQAQQSSRLVIFGSDTTYVARFTGDKVQQPVLVQFDQPPASLDLDGSDLIIDPWTSVTAFSYRTAVVADGILYYWGPQGVYRDDGVATPTKISSDLEPWIFTVYDPTKTPSMHCVYDAQTKEITWFYTPKTADSGYLTHSIVYNVQNQTFLRGKFVGQVDWAQNLELDTGTNSTSPLALYGKRVVIGQRLSTTASAIQRAYFYDQRNRSGDIGHHSTWMVKEVATPSTGVRRLTLAAGYDATNFATFAVGDYIALQQTNDYARGALTGTELTGDDMIATVAAVNTGAGTLDITLPAGAALTTAALDYFAYFPFWQCTPTGPGINGISYNLPTGYWVPAGMGGYFFWLYCYMLSKITLWKTDLGLGTTISYRSATATSSISDNLTFANNSDGNWQLYHPLRPGNDNHEGQGLKFTWSGVHIGHEWVLQYMEAHGTPISGDVLKRFEG